MATPRLELPVLQNWSCHNCGGCCRQHLIEVTEEERQRLIGQNWTAADGVDRPILEWHAGPPWKKRYRLAHREDGGCVFLNEQGLCRIHAKFGEPAKPLACRIYPYAFHPKGKGFSVSLRYSCPSVVANLGTAVVQQTGDLRQLAELVIPPGADKSPPPKLTARDRVDWNDFLSIVDSLDQTLADTSVSIVTRIVRAITWTTLVGQATFEKLKGPRIRELIGLLTEAAAAEYPSSDLAVQEPSSLGRLYFRTLVAQYARKDTVADLSAGWFARWKLFRAILKFTRGQGDIPPLQPLFKPVPFNALEKPFGPLDPAAEELFTRYFRVKIQGMHFCGPGYYDVPFAEGFHSLALMFPVTLWLARWIAAGDGRTQLTIEDISTALTVADHHHGYSPALALPASRSRVRTLAESNDLTKLCIWYAR